MLVVFDTKKRSELYPAPPRFRLGPEPARDDQCCPQGCWCVIWSTTGLSLGEEAGRPKCGVPTPDGGLRFSFLSFVGCDPNTATAAVGCCCFCCWHWYSRDVYALDAIRYSCLLVLLTTDTYTVNLCLRAFDNMLIARFGNHGPDAPAQG